MPYINSHRFGGGGGSASPEILNPNGGSGSWSGSYTSLNDDSDTTSMSEVTDGQQHTFTLDDTVLTTETVGTVNINARIADDLGTTDVIQFDFRVGGVSQGIVQKVCPGMPTDYVIHHAGWDGPWTPAQLNGAEIRVTYILDDGDSNTVHLYELELEVNFT